MPRGKLVAVEGIEPTSLDYQSSALPLSYTAMVDPTGLKPAPHGLKGRCSVTRAPGQEIGCGGRTRTFDNRINSPVPYQLGYATKNWATDEDDFDLEARGGVEPRAFRPALRFGLEDRCRERGPRLEAMVRFELTLTCLQDRRPAS